MKIEGLKLFVLVAPFQGDGSLVIDREGAWTDEIHDDFFEFAEDPPRVGLLVWEGEADDKVADQWVGTWRAPTAEEMARLAAGRFPLRDHAFPGVGNLDTFEPMEVLCERAAYVVRWHWQGAATPTKDTCTSLEAAHHMMLHVERWGARSIEVLAVAEDGVMTPLAGPFGRGRGYVVKDTNPSGAVGYAVGRDGVLPVAVANYQGAKTVYESLDVADSVAVDLMREGCMGVRVCRVGDDGSETPMLTYAELARMRGERTWTSFAEFRGTPEYRELAERAKAATAALDAVYADLARVCPAPPGLGWALGDDGEPILFPREEES